VNSILRREITFETSDGTKLFADDRGPLVTQATPLLCLPGLTRNSKDFSTIFEMYADNRRVIAMDLRGRGRSSYATDAKSYKLVTELSDVIGLLDHIGIARVAVLGTSRGGLIGQLMAASFNNRLAGLLLNDIGPEINPQGLKRILNYVGKAISIASWDEAASTLANQSPGFSGVSSEKWKVSAKRIYIECDGQFIPDYDLRLGKNSISFADIDAGKVPDLWSITSALLNIPVTVLRGAGSDLLDETTVHKMKAQLPALKHYDVANRGHVPFLDEPESVDAIHEWLTIVDANEKGR
jgi:pimeloyl-ACP methyl ester carboxylesterase